MALLKHYYFCVKATELKIYGWEIQNVDTTNTQTCILEDLLDHLQVAIKIKYFSH